METCDKISVTSSTTSIYSSLTGLPQKRYFRQRAHSNPIADHILDYPIKPDDVDWSTLYPFYFNRKDGESNEESKQEEKQVDFIDIGCGYGGLLLKLSELYPDNLSLGESIDECSIGSNSQ